MRISRMVHIVGILFFILCCGFSVSLAAEDTPTESNPPVYSNDDLLSRMLIVQASEQLLNGIPALSVTFSQQLDNTAQFDRFFTVTEKGQALKGGWVLATNPRRLYFPHIQPNTDYRIQVRPGIESASGLKLQSPGDFKVKTRDIKSAFDFAARGSILPAQLTEGLPIRVVNVPELDIEFLRVKPEKLKSVLRSMRLDHSIRSWKLNEVHDLTESVYSGRYTTDARRNARETMLLPVESIAALKEPGLYFAVMREPGRFTESAYRITHFVVTNIGLHARLYKKKLEVFARELSSGKQLADVALKLHGAEEILQAETDEKGHGTFDFRPKAASLLTAELEGQFAFLDLREAAIDLSDYPVTGLPDKVLTPFVYAPRDLYRPGELVDLSVLLRNRDGLPEAVKNLNLRLVRPDAKLLLENNLVAHDEKLGYFSYQFTIPAAAPTGLWRAEVRISSKDKSPAQVFSFNVEEFMPERMKLSLSNDKKLLEKSERQVIAVQGDYLYGAPAAGNKLKATRVMALDRHPVVAYKDYYFGNPEDEKRLVRKALDEIKLDEKGSGFLDIDPVAAGITSALKLKVIANLSEPGGRVVTRSIDDAYWPAKSMVGIAPAFKEDVVERDSEAQFNIVRVNAEGVLLAGENLSATLIKEDYEYFWEYNEQEGWTRKEIRNEYPLTQQKFTVVAGEKSSLVFPVAYGRYRLEVEDSDTGLKSVYAFHAGWSGEQAVSDRPDKVELQLDKKAYKAGETVELKILPSSDAEAVVTVEGDSLLWSEVVSLSTKGTTVSIPVGDDWARHDLYISVAAFRPSGDQKSITPGRALGIVHLPLQREERKLNLSITAPGKVLPEQKVKILISSDDLKGESAIMSLAAVDVGVLNITDYKTPDPWAFFFDQRKYSVDLYDDYGKIIDVVEGKSIRQRFGGGSTGSAGGARSRADIKVISLFQDRVSFDEQGQAEVELYIPGFDGQLRLMVVGASEQKMGSAEKDMLVASPVVASLSGPRFLASGDSSFLMVELNNVSDSEQPVQLDVAANKFVDFVDVDSVFVLKPGQKELLKLPIAAGQNFGVGQIRLKMTGKDFVANRDLEMELRPPYPGQRKRDSKEVLAGAEHVIPGDFVDAILPETLQAQLTVSSVPPLPVGSALRDLLKYPYGCLEQTTSGAYPYLFLDADATDRWGLSPLTMEQRNDRIQAALLNLTGMQLGNGFFTLWGSYGSAEHWLTPYVADFLLDAQRQGFSVPVGLSQRTLKRLEATLQEGYSRPVSRYGFSDHPEHMGFAARAYAAYVLARENRASLGTLRTLLKNEASKAVSGLPLVHLGLALILQGDKPKGNEAIQRGLKLFRDKDVYLGDYGSQLRDRAMMLYQLLLNKQKIDDLAVQLKILSELVYERNYFSTQEQVFIYLLSRELEKRAGDSWKARLVMNEQTLELSQAGDYLRILTADDFKSIKLVSQHDKPLYMSLDVQGYPKQAPAEQSKPVAIKREWFALDGKKVPEQSVKLGDLLLTRLTVKSEKTLNDALIVDLLPSGFEIENTNLLDNQVLQSVKLEGMSRPVLDLISDTSLKTEEFRDDRYVAALKLNADATHHLFYMVRVITGGNTVIPPPYMEDMYRPYIHAIGSTPGRLSIK
ncbi:MAG: Alpha-2-macroglobulin [uncultured Thiotrichaceae bacterium]|uniref:Alpha-2-macroglobulin n=1 Tax=uncultured Thiotrichaceae bacterium TaxID=298394 RepID=A0A6S6T9J1_9GAMM|nr:MAG: Alpha-2-macroglobulin [uncultured Thiotrichaceae bacterium]